MRWTGTARDVAARSAEITGGGAHVSVEALGIATTTNGSIGCLRPMGRDVQIGMPVGHTALTEINMNAVRTKNLALFGTRGMPALRYPSLLSLIETGRVAVARIVAREVALSDASAELRAFNGPTAPGVAVISTFAAQTSAFAAWTSSHPVFFAQISHGGPGV